VPSAWIGLRVARFSFVQHTKNYPECNNWRKIHVPNDLKLYQNTGKCSKGPHFFPLHGPPKYARLWCENTPSGNPARTKSFQTNRNIFRSCVSNMETLTTIPYHRAKFLSVFFALTFIQ
jgi:hypothetical protein